MTGSAGLPDDGPVQFGEADATQGLGLLARGGSKVVFGATYVVNTGDKPATLRAASLEGDVPEDAARVVEVRALNPAEHDGELFEATTPWSFMVCPTSSKDCSLPPN